MLTNPRDAFRGHSSLPATNHVQSCSGLRPSRYSYGTSIRFAWPFGSHTPHTTLCPDKNV